jgi:hypothetical protein
MVRIITYVTPSDVKMLIQEVDRSLEQHLPLPAIPVPVAGLTMQVLPDIHQIETNTKDISMRSSTLIYQELVTKTKEIDVALSLWKLECDTTRQRLEQTMKRIKLLLGMKNEVAPADEDTTKHEEIEIMENPPSDEKLNRKKIDSGLNLSVSPASLAAVIPEEPTEIYQTERRPLPITPSRQRMLPDPPTLEIIKTLDLKDESSSRVDDSFGVDEKAEECKRLIMAMAEYEEIQATIGLDHAVDYLNTDAPVLSTELENDLLSIFDSFGM